MLVRCVLGRWSFVPDADTVIADSKGGCLFIDREAYAIGAEIDETPALFAGSDQDAAALAERQGTSGHHWRDAQRDRR